MVSPILRGNPFALELRLAPAGSVWAERRYTRIGIGALYRVILVVDLG